MTKRYWYFLWLIPFLLAACAPVRVIPAPQGDNSQQPTQTAAQPPDTPLPAMTPSPGSQVKAPISTSELQPWEPRPADSALQRGTAYIDKESIGSAQDTPSHFQIALSGSLPTPCHQLRVKVNPPAGNQQIDLEVYSVVNPDRICAQVLAPFNVKVPLQGFPVGRYSVLVNGEKVGEVVLP